MHPLRHLLFVAALAACAETAAPPALDAAPTPDGDAASPQDVAPSDALRGDVAPDLAPDAPAPLQLHWQPCGTWATQAHATARCADVEVPLDWSNPTGERIQLYLRHLPARTPSGRALWVLMGGPGQAGADGEGLAAVLAQRDPGLDLYLPDHRGTGESTYLGCPGPEAPDSPGGPTILPGEWPACRDEVVARWGTRLRHFSATMAARDVAALVDAVGPRDNYVLGISYGTYLANRYLQVAPRQARGVVFDSYCPPDECKLSLHDPREDEVAREILARCAREPDCARRLGDDPVARLRALHPRVAAGHCSFAPTAAQRTWLFRSALGNMAMSAAMRRGIPAVIHRFERCEPADRAALQHLYAAVIGPQWLAASELLGRWAPPAGGGSGPRGYSFALAMNIVTSELWEESDPSPAELARRWNEALVCRGVGRQLGWQSPGWPRYQEPLARRYAETDIPLLVLQAELDPATPARFARAVTSRLRGAHQRYVEIPGSAHTTVAQGGLNEDPTTTCGRELLLQFVRDPRATLDTACVGRTIPMGFSASAALSNLLFGAPSHWGDP